MTLTKALHHAWNALALLLVLTAAAVVAFIGLSGGGNQ